MASVLKAMQQGLCSQERWQRSGAGEDHKVLKEGYDGRR